jgi:hypothetical protein
MEAAAPLGFARLIEQKVSIARQRSMLTHARTPSFSCGKDILEAQLLVYIGYFSL